MTSPLDRSSPPAAVEGTANFYVRPTQSPPNPAGKEKWARSLEEKNRAHGPHTAETRPPRRSRR